MVVEEGGGVAWVRRTTESVADCDDQFGHPGIEKGRESQDALR